MSLYALLYSAAAASASSSVFQLAPSKDSFGPDGPWQAVEVGLGTPPQTVNLYPVGLEQSVIFSKGLCAQYENVTCGSGGLFDASDSESFDNTTIAGYVPYGRFDGSARSVMDTLTLTAAADSGEQDLEVRKFDMALFFSDTSTLPDTTVYPEQLGHLSLGSDLNQGYGPPQNVSPPVNATLIPGGLKQEGAIGSNSYGLHYGSGAFNLPLSLWLGGYDATRIVGPVFAGPAVNKAFQIELIDIDFGVETGASPFSSTSEQSILPTTNPLTVQMDTGNPYLYLPTEVCQSLAQNLPVTFQTKYGLYFWNTSDPQYARIVTSPSYLRFTFNAPKLSSGNLTINVPFQLLNLTLSSPLIATPTAYFPCSPTTDSTVYTLGRAFLQAAFFGVNWSAEPAYEWYLAQAPGPNIPPSPSGVAFGDNVTGGGGNWSETWKNNWTPLPEASQSSSTVPSSSSAPSATTSPTRPASPSSSLSDGAKAGIAVGAVGFVGLIVGAAVFYMQRRRSTGRTTQTGNNNKPIVPGPPPVASEQHHRPASGGAFYEAPDHEPVEMSHPPGLSHELPSTGAMYEAPSRYTLQ